MVPAPRDPPQLSQLVKAFPAPREGPATPDAFEAELPTLPEEPQDVLCSTGVLLSPRCDAAETGNGSNSPRYLQDELDPVAPTRSKGSSPSPKNSPRGSAAVNAAAPSREGPSQVREHVKCVAALLLVFGMWAGVFAIIDASSANYAEPDCGAFEQSVLAERATCEECGSGTIVLPIFGEYEQAWPNGLRIVLYTAAILCIFMGMGLICDQFMSAIEEITSAEKVVWREVRDGAKHKFRIKVWNPTIANLTLMALGSSAPEILLSTTELIGRNYFAGSLGPSTIVGSAAFNLFCISAVCVSAIPPPETRMVVGYGTFMVTALVSLLAYVWLLIILLIITPKKVDILEGVITLVFFPIFLSVAFAADKGWGCFRAVPTQESHQIKILDKCKSRMLEQFGTVVDTLPPETLKLLMRASSAVHEFPKETQTKATSRKAIIGKMTGGLTRLHRQTTFGDLRRQRGSDVSSFNVGFAEDKHVILENVGTLQVQVVLSCPVDSWIRMQYRTREGTAKEGLRYRHVEGNVTFQPGCVSKWIAVPIIDDEEWEPQEEFYIALSDLKVASTKRQSKACEAIAVRCLEEARGSSILSPRQARGTISSILSPRRGNSSPRSNSKEAYTSNASPSPDFGGSNMLSPTNIFWKCQVTTVTVLNDDIPGTLDFDTDEVLAHEGDIVKVGVCRLAGSCGNISCQYETISDSAMEGKDFEPTSGTLYFGNGETHKEIVVKILKNNHNGYEDAERFQLKLFNASLGVNFDKNTNGGETQAICDIVIAADSDPAPPNLEIRLMRAMSHCIDFDRWSVGLELWWEHARDSLYCRGSIADQAEAGVMDWVCHAISLIFKVLFIFVPPPILCNGWLCFMVALLMIGVVTALAGDVASLLGCCIGIPDDITAITLVALGTSLPDTLASKAAATQDQYADNAIGNITGSNSVNVFLGIGISWTIGAVYWRVQGPTVGWQEHKHNDVSFRDLYLPDFERGGFFVPTDTLAFSVSAYVCGAFCCLAMLRFRRVRFGGELGGPELNQYIDASLLASLWFLYIFAVSLYASTT